MIAIDIGSGMTKFAVPGESGMIVDMWPTVAGRVEDRDLGVFSYEDMKDVVFNDERWVVGADAESGLPESMWCDTLLDTWAGSDGWMAILYRVISKVHAGGGDLGEITVVTGLPQARYREQRERLTRLLSGTHEFNVGGGAYRVDISPIIVPQAFSALLCAARRNAEVMKTPTGIIDVGTFTTGYSVLSGGRMQHWRSGGVDVGLYRLQDLVADWVEREYRFRPSRSAMIGILKEGELLARGERVGIREVVEQLTSEAFTPLLDKLSDSWNGAPDILVRVAGGGAALALPVIRRQIPHAQIVDDAPLAVVSGMLEYAMSLPKKESRGG